MGKIVLCAYVHNDRQLSTRLSDVLANYQPSVITREWFNDGKRDPTISQMVLTTGHYSQQKGIPTHDIDQFWEERIPKSAIDPMFAVNRSFAVIRAQQILFAKYKEIYGESIPASVLVNIRAYPLIDLTKFGLNYNPDILYDLYDAIRSGKIDADELKLFLESEGLPLATLTKANRSMSEQIRSLVPSEGTLLHFGGLFHFVDMLEISSMQALLSDLSPHAITVR